ncbi:hypothetical protein JZ751_020360 [Albula glossodonta]|uniref:Uncharacterized protein n=1 Tax=Albula glossodonta TaxID=121402 RepID=A0A8T2NTA7_9TELE|nr:hypothetical protein JZ751_020360 [Albula glossodonta]
MFSYTRYGNFTWKGTLKDWDHCLGKEQVRPTMATSGTTGLEVLLTTLKDVEDTEGTLNILNVLDELLSADKRIGLKAESADAVLLTLGLLRQNVGDARRAAACLWVLRVFCSSEANSRCAVAKGYVSSLLKLYEDWHSKDVTNAYVPIRRALLHCLHHATNTSAGREALLAQGGMALLFRTTQAFQANKAVEPLVEVSIQLMRKCLPKCPLPLISDQSAYIFPLPGGPASGWDTFTGNQDNNLEEDSDDDARIDDSDSKEYDDDLETDPDKLRARPKPDRPLEELGQYMHLCPELHHDFQDLDVDTEAEDSSDEEVFADTCSGSEHKDRMRGGSRHIPCPKKQTAPGEVETSLAQGGRPKGSPLSAQDFHSCCLSSPSARQDGQRLVDQLLDSQQPCIPHHDPRLYAAAAAHTKSIPGFSVLAFPDFWGHLPPRGQEPMAIRNPNVQRYPLPLLRP